MVAILTWYVKAVILIFKSSKEPGFSFMTSFSAPRRPEEWYTCLWREEDEQLKKPGEKGIGTIGSATQVLQKRYTTAVYSNGKTIVYSIHCKGSEYFQITSSQPPLLNLERLLWFWAELNSFQLSIQCIDLLCGITFLMSETAPVVAVHYSLIDYSV